MKNKIADTMYGLLELYPYRDVSIRVICESVPISRATFYHHFKNKDGLAAWMVKRQYYENAIPLFRHHLKELGVQSFFTYIKSNQSFYQRLYEHDQGRLLFHCLSAAYNSGVDLSGSYSRPARLALPPIDPEVYRRYSTTGIAATVTYWIEGGMAIPIEKIAGDLHLMMDNPLGTVRDSCLGSVSENGSCDFIFRTI